MSQLRSPLMRDLEGLLCPSTLYYVLSTLYYFGRAPLKHRVGPYALLRAGCCPSRGLNKIVVIKGLTGFYTVHMVGHSRWLVSPPTQRWILIICLWLVFSPTKITHFIRNQPNTRPLLILNLW